MDSIYHEIEALKKERNAVVLAHYYVPEEVQACADYIGDSFYLSKLAAGLAAKVLVFAGVSFMGESAKILSPDKKVLMPEPTADCPMAHMATKEKIQEMREKYDDLAVVCYINSTGELKTYSDICVTSANAVKIVKGLPNKNIFFIPDVNLGRYVAQQVPEKNVILNDGYCPVHKDVTTEQVLAVKNSILTQNSWYIRSVVRKLWLLQIMQAVHQVLLNMLQRAKKQNLSSEQKTVFSMN